MQNQQNSFTKDDYITHLIMPVLKHVIAVSYHEAIDTGSASHRGGNDDLAALKTGLKSLLKVRQQQEKFEQLLVDVDYEYVHSLCDAHNAIACLSASSADIANDHSQVDTTSTEDLKASHNMVLIQEMATLVYDAMLHEAVQGDNMCYAAQETMAEALRYVVSHYLNQYKDVWKNGSIQESDHSSFDTTLRRYHEKAYYDRFGYQVQQIINTMVFTDPQAFIMLNKGGTGYPQSDAPEQRKLISYQGGDIDQDQVAHFYLRESTDTSAQGNCQLCVPFAFMIKDLKAQHQNALSLKNDVVLPSASPSVENGQANVESSAAPLLATHDGDRQVCHVPSQDIQSMFRDQTKHVEDVFKQCKEEGQHKASEDKLTKLAAEAFREHEDTYLKKNKVNNSGMDQQTNSQLMTEFIESYKEALKLANQYSQEDASRRPGSKL